MIVETAMEMFLAEGFGATTVEALSARLRMSKATFYARFPSKAAVLEAGMSELSGRLIPSTLDHGDDDVPFDQRLAKVGEYLLHIALRPDMIALERLAMAESYRFPKLAQVIHEKGSMEVIRFLTEFFRNAADRGEIRPVDTQLLAEHYMDIMLIFIRRAAHGIGSTEVDDEARNRLAALTDLLMKPLRV